MITPLQHRRFIGIAAAVLIASMGCSQGGSAGSQATEGIDVQRTQFSLTVTNRSGLPLVDVRVEIVPYGRATTFTSSYPRMENSEKREFSFSDFRGRDGTPFNQRVVKARAIVVTGKDLDNQEHKVEVSW